eukprot:TRINITY_DN48604_c0_g1_i1.p1 TRINITY_DN48604_c0_g1~~TRINITY_DN48604_c0_g1_i1.p1  ORF type:complete len:476 (-),score=61.84 TRINITY_DN48604_c0_g1_i1:148-1575(-)
MASVADQLKEKAAKFHHIYFRSVLDEPEAIETPDAQWAKLLASGDVIAHVAAKIQVATPESVHAETSLVGVVNSLAEALSSPEALKTFYQHFGWANPGEYFGALGESQLMVVDVDHNDSDDRLAIVMLAYQMASANMERRLSNPSASCTLLLDARTYAEASGLCMWRTLVLVARLNRLLGDHGLSVEPVFGDRRQVLKKIAEYLKLPEETSSLNERIDGIGSILEKDGRGGSWSSLSTCWLDDAVSSVWILGGLCAAQISDLETYARKGKHLLLIEQAQPAWQHVDVGSNEVQPMVDPSDSPMSLSSFGAEPSNVRSSAASYPETLEVYVNFQRLAERFPANVRHAFPALARKSSMLPVPPGKQMLRVSGRPLNVKIGTEYQVMTAHDAQSLSAAFSKLLSAAEEHCKTTLYVELCISCEDDFGNTRSNMAPIMKYGTFMADAICVCLAARPASHVNLQTLTRRLAIVRAKLNND